MATRSSRRKQDTPERDAELREKGDPGEPGGGVEREGDLKERQDWFLARRRAADGTIVPDSYLRASLRRRQLEREQGGVRVLTPPEGKRNGKRAGGSPGTGEGHPSGQPGPAGSVNWTPLGPSALAFGNGRYSNSGRVSSIAVGPSGTRAYVGAANGGLWFTADGGATWAPLNEFATSSPIASLDADSQSTGAVAVRFGASAATDLVYVGTGEASGAYDSYQGIGVQRSASGGAAGTWSLEATNLAGTSIGALAIDPDNPAYVVAGTGKGIFRRPTTGSTSTWPQATAGLSAPNSPVSDLVVAGSGASKLYYAAFPAQNRIYSSPDGITWTAVATLPAGSVSRIGLAVAESNPSVVYAFRDDAVLLRLNAGSWNTVASTPPASAVFAPTGQGWYDLIVAVDPTNANIVYLGGQAMGGLALYKGTITGGPGSYSYGFTNTAQPYNDATFVGSGIHADGHTLAFALNSAGTAHVGSNVWVGTDGGLWQSSASGANSTFVARNHGLAINEISHIAQRADTDAVLFGTSQDNGTGRFLGEEVWRSVDGGDGGGIAMDQNNPSRVMHQYAGGSGFYESPPGSGTWYLASCLAASQNGGSTFAGVTWPPYTANTAAQRAAVNAEPVGFVAPLVSSPPGVSPSLVAFGSNRLWLSSDWGASWVTLPSGTNPYSSATPSGTQDVLDGNVITAIAIASDRLVFAATPAQVWRFDKNTTTGVWTKTAITTSGLPSYRYIAGIAVDGVSGTCYIALGSVGSAHLYYYDGSTWHIALPTSQIDTPANAVVVDPANAAIVYVGTDVGVWKGVKTGPTAWSWTVYSQGLPEVAVVDLAIHQPTRLLRAGTHGRGVWEIPIDAASGSDPDIYLRVNAADTGRLVGGARFGFVEGAVDPTRTSAHVYHWMSADIKVRRSSLGGLPPVTYPVDDLDFAVNIGDYVDTTDIETVDTTGTDQIFVEVHNRSNTALAANAVRVALLLTDASAGLPALPTDYVTHLNDLSTNSTSWLPSTSPWKFANPPYRYLNGPLDVHTPQVVEFDVSNLGSILPGTDHVCAAAFVTTAGDQILSTDTASLDYTTMHDKHVSHRNLHLVAAGATPITSPGEGATAYRQQARTFLLDFHNSGKKAASVDMVFDKALFPGHLSVMLPKRRELTDPEKSLDGFVLHERNRVTSQLAHGLGEWLEDVGEILEQFGHKLDGEPDDDQVVPHRQLQRLAALDRSRVFVAEDVLTPRVLGVKIPAGGKVSAAVTVQPPKDARPGDTYRLDVLQTVDGAIVGGSTYVIAVTEADR